MKQLTILHISVQNDAGVPLEYVRCHRARGHRSFLFTLHRNPYLPPAPEETILDYPDSLVPLVTRYRTRLLKKRSIVHERKGKRPPAEIPPVFHSGIPGAGLARRVLDLLVTPRVTMAIRKHDLDHADIVHLDGGADFYSDGRFVRRLKKQGARIICCYHGSDLRLRGVFPAINRVADAHITSEYDLLNYHPSIEHLFYPFDENTCGRLRAEPPQKGSPLRIAHSPTDRQKKGTAYIIEVVRNLGKTLPVELVLIEKMARPDALRLKCTCHMLIDQIGNAGGTGYGVSALESFSMRQMVITDFSDDYGAFLSPHPFVLATPSTLEAVLRDYIENPGRIAAQSEAGAGWLKKRHGYSAVQEKLAGLYGRFGLKY